MNIEPETFTSFAERYLHRLYSDTAKFNELTMRGSPMLELTMRGSPMLGAAEPPPPTTAAKCECGSGSHERSGAHSHWCQLWMAP